MDIVLINGVNFSEDNTEPQLGLIALKKVLNETTEPPKQCNRCLKKCTYKFCVNERLVKAHDGNYEEGIFFAGRDAWKINEILSVKEIFDRFKKVFKE